MVRTRFAPSPTGYLHIGGVRTALFNWLFARHHGGQFILRIDDTDQQRNVEESLRPILDGFSWLGLDWDEGPEVGGPHAPYYQSQRQVHYQRAVDRLLSVDAAYYDYARPEEVQKEREAAERDKRPFLYSRHFLARTDADRARFEAEGRQAVVRLKMPREGRLQLDDLIRDRVDFDWAREQDHVIQRADGSFLYHLATVIDDHDFQISHVIRAEEHLSNTPRQVFIAQQLGFESPRFAHLPFVAEPASRMKLSKRKLEKYLQQPAFKALNDLGQRIGARLGLDVRADTFNPVIVDFYRQIGFLPDAVVNYLLLLGWSLDDRTEDFSRSEMIAQFSLERINRSPASFDPQKLLAFQERYMQRLPIKQAVALVLPFLQRAGLVSVPPPCDTAPYLTRVLRAAGERIKVAGEILDYEGFFVADDRLAYDPKAFDKHLRRPAEATRLLARFRARLADEAVSFDAASLERLLKDFVVAEGVQIGQIIHALRVAVTGKSVGFGLFESLEILGRQRCLARIGRALELGALRTPSPPSSGERAG